MILILGYKGFIGSHLMDLCGENSDGLDLLSGSDILTLSDDDVTGYERVIHCAGTLGTLELFGREVEAVNANIVGTLRVLQSCQASSVPMTYLTLGNNWLNPYSITKNCASDFCGMYREVYKANIQTAITYNVFGPGQKLSPVRKIVPEFIWKALNGLPITIHENCRKVDMVFVRDLCNHILRNNSSGLVHYGTGIAIDVVDVANTIGEIIGKPIKIERIPPRQGETGDSAISPVPMTNPTPFKDAMVETVNWYKKEWQL